MRKSVNLCESMVCNSFGFFSRFGDAQLSVLFSMNMGKGVGYTRSGGVAALRF